jgi:[NiFe] hydrogenase assembly HybE family chaperone
MAEPAPVAGYATDPGPRLAAVFRTVHETRMHGVPILNPAIAVESVGFAPWDAHWLGCLVTPWFMNLVLLPRMAERWVRLRPGEKHTYVFPASAFEFIGGREEAIGEYQACSLFSPMFEFADHATARSTAEACLRALFDPGNVEHADIPLATTFETPAEEAEGAVAQGAAEPHGSRVPLDARLDAPMSKREFLRGKFFDHGTGR